MFRRYILIISRLQWVSRASTDGLLLSLCPPTFPPLCCQNLAPPTSLSFGGSPSNCNCILPNYITPLSGGWPGPWGKLPKSEVFPHSCVRKRILEQRLLECQLRCIGALQHLNNSVYMVLAVTCTFKCRKYFMPREPKVQHNSKGMYLGMLCVWLKSSIFGSILLVKLFQLCVGCAFRAVLHHITRLNLSVLLML